MPQQPARAALDQADAEDQALNYDGLDQLLGFRLRIAHIAMYRDFLSELAPVQVTQRQVAVLWLIGANPGISQADLGAALLMDSATMVAVIDRLEDEGRVIRVRSKTDRRRRELHLAPAGMKALKKAKSAIARHENRFASSLSESERPALLAILGKLAGLP